MARFLFIGLALFWSFEAQAFRVPDLLSWEATMVQVQKDHSIYRQYRNGDQILEILATGNGELALITWFRHDRRKEYVNVDGHWQRCQVIEITENVETKTFSVVYSRRKDVLEVRFSSQ